MFKNSIKRYFFSSSACAYNKNLQSDPDIDGLREEDTCPALPKTVMVGKLFSERMCRHFGEDYGLETRVARFHNIYGPLGTFDGGREKAPAAICRKVIEAKSVISIALMFGAMNSNKKLSILMTVLKQFKTFSLVASN